MYSRQTVPFWKNGEIVPNTETLRLISQIFNISINTLHGTPKVLNCQCCGMPLENTTLSREPDGSFNEDYCKWCYKDGNFVYQSLEEITDFLVDHRSNENRQPEKARAFFEKELPELNPWKKKLL